MSLSINSKKIIASVMALSIVASGVISSEASIFSKIVPTNTISASAAISYGDWEYEETGTYTAKLTKYKGNGGYVIIPESINGHSIKQLGDGLFQNNTAITSVAIPRGVTEIPRSCFNGATKLKSVAIPHGVTKIGYYAFEGTTSLESLSLPTTIDTIDFEAFWKSGISNISIPSATKISGNAFKNCEKLKSITLPNNLKTLTGGAFQGCKSLESVTIPASVNWLGGSAFADCTNLKTATIKSYPDRSLGGALFKNCTALENINIPNDNRLIHNIVYGETVNNCPNFRKVNNERIITYRSQRYNPNAEPIMRADFMEEVMQNFAKVDKSKIGFFEEYLNASIKYIVGTNTHSGMTTGQKIRALHDWVCDKVNYAFAPDGSADPSTECHVDSSVFMRDTTVCDGYARALTLLLREAGIETYYLSSSSHAWCMVKLGNRYFHVDPTHDDNPRDYDHFLKSDNDISKCTQGHKNWKITSPRDSRINYTISPMPACQYSIGDVNMDHVIDKKDVQLIQDYKLNLAQISDLTLADTNLDGEINLADAINLIQLYPSCRG